MAGPATVQNSSQGFATIPNQYATALAGGWVLDQRLDSASSTGGFVVNCSPSSSGGSFSSTGDGSTGTGNGFYAIGRPMRAVQGATTLYAPITAATFSAGITTVSFST